MSIKTSRSSRDKKPGVALEIRPGKVQQGGTVLVSGSGWPLDAIVFKIGKETLKPDRILNGSIWNGLLVPDPAGSFLIEISTGDKTPGRYKLRAETHEGGLSREGELLVEKRTLWAPDVDRAKLDKPYLRGAAFKKLRIGNRPGWPEGLVDAIRNGGWQGGPLGGGIFYVAPVHGACNWVPLGPAPFCHGKGSMHANNSGRIRCIAIDPSEPRFMYAGTACGGVWKSEDRGVGWVPTSDNAFSLAIGALAIDPVHTNIVYAGTGEMIPGADYNNYYGRGILQSTTHGDSWTEIGVTEFALAEIARIVINPLDTANLFVAASNGLWERRSSGSSWTCLSPIPCTDVVLVQDPAAAGTRRLVAGFSTRGIFRAENSGSGWTFDPVPVSGAPADTRRIVFGVCRTQPRHIYAAFSTGGDGNMLAHVSRSGDRGATWTPCTIPGTATGRIYQASYNLAIQPHPDDPETVILAVVDVFKSTNGGRSWTNVSYGGGTRVHADCHAIAFHPSVSSSLFVTCDGGLFFSPDVCATWQARNLDISTIQFYELSQHPRYDAIMIGGSLDNGGFHYSGAPIWKRTWVAPGVTNNSMDGDGVVAAIDPFDPYYHYYGTGPEGKIKRSDDGGKLFPHVWAKFPGTEWWIPFYPDPRREGVLYTGGTRLMRGESRGDTWNPVTADLAAPIRALGFHPENPLVLYVGTVRGQVYRITGPATGSWDPTRVTKDDVTFTGLPPGIGISSLAVDPSGNVWASISDLIHAEGTGEFTNHHVFRLDDGATSWSLKSDGLAMANPINTIVIDPHNSARVFCGGDRGVFAWDADAAHPQWNPMDEGLPNAPVFKLLIHNPSRKIRAATHGRGAWERSLDAPSCPDYFLYFRDNLTDSGSTPSPDGVPHPYIRGELCWHWQSKDIIVDPSRQTPSVVTTPTELYDKVVHLGGRRGANRVYVTVHNKGPFAVTDVRVRAFVARAAGRLPGFPPGMLANPFSWSPGAGTPLWNPIGTAAFPIGRIEPGTTRLAYWEFVIPATADRHSCIMAFATSAEDPFSSGGITDPDQLVIQNRKVTLKNLDLDAMPSPGGGGGIGGERGTGGDRLPSPEGSTAPRELLMHGRDESGLLFNAVITCGKMPSDAVVVVAVDKEHRKNLEIGETELTQNGRKVKQIFATFPEHPKELQQYDLKNLIVRDAGSGKEIPIGDVVIRKGKPMGLVIWVHSWKWDQNERYSFDIVQMGEDKVTGGFTVRIVDPKSSEGLRTMDSQDR